MSTLDHPDDLRYTSDHEWVRSDGDTVRIGITAFAQEALGDVVYVSLRPSATPSASVTPAARSSRRSRSATSTRRSKGRSTATNPALEATPELINSDPYGEGWMFEMRLADVGALDGLMEATPTARRCPEPSSARPHRPVSRRDP